MFGKICEVLFGEALFMISSLFLVVRCPWAHYTFICTNQNAATFAKQALYDHQDGPGSQPSDCLGEEPQPVHV